MTETRYSPELGAVYFDREIAPSHRASGVPEEALLWMGSKYLRDVAANPAAQSELVADHGALAHEPMSVFAWRIADKHRHSA